VQAAGQASTFCPCKLRFLMLILFTSSAASGDVGEGPWLPRCQRAKKGALRCPSIACWRNMRSARMR